MQDFQAAKWPFYLFVIMGILGLPGAGQGQAAEIRIGATIPFDAEWENVASPEQRRFIAALRDPALSGVIETVPHNRKREMYADHKLDCILTADWVKRDVDIVADKTIRFVLRLFTAPGMDLNARGPAVSVGFLAHTPRPPLSILRDVEWYGLRSIRQGVDLLAAGRLDAIVADESHVFPTPPYQGGLVIVAPLSPVQVVALLLICHDTPANRHFVARFDQLMAISGDMLNRGQGGWPYL
ncbi:hypothetical protein [Thalassospira sp.]|uniref:hypothetical protein n=1 Tax=Thalassospira sp. TaxID=1912094 RepID=UPI002733EEE9|nr:hypothetical protein [Thalassospira sp.]MDP2697452.1 hypothetical protein [Thalassospira sp.]